MTLITDPDDLSSTEVTISTAARTITLNIAGNLSTDGVTLQCLYSYLKEEWKSDAALIPYPFPMLLITPEKGEFVDNWEPANDSSRKLIRTGGWREYDSNDNLKEEWVGCISLDIGSKTIDAGDYAYYHFSSLSSKTDFTYDGVVNEAIQTYGDATHGNFDYRSDVLTLYLREQGKTFASATSTAIGYSINDYSVGRYPLGEETDIKITASDNTIETTTPYTNMGIEFFATPQSQNIPSSGDPHNFGLTVDGATGTVEEIYEFTQYCLRQNSDIDDGAGTHLGTLTDQLAVFIGDRLDTLAVTNSEGGGTGVFLDNVATADTNSFRCIDNLGTYYEYPFVSTGDMIFNTNLQNDSNAIYRMYWYYTHAYTIADLAISSSSGDSASLDSAGGNLPTLAQNDYIYIEGASNAQNNGLWKITDATPSSTQADADKIDGLEPTDETSFSATLGLNPYGTPDTILVDDNSDTDISGIVDGNASISYDFDFDGNVQGGRTPAVNAEVIVACIGHDTAQFTTARKTITRSTGNDISIQSSLERNYSNPV